MSSPIPSVVLFVRDVPRLTRFYQELAQMTRVDGDDGHTVLAVAGIQLVIHALRSDPESKLAPAGQVEAREDSYLKLCLPVSSIAEARMLAARLGGAIQPVDREWEARGVRACDGHDPEGNVLQFREAVA